MTKINNTPTTLASKLKEAEVFISSDKTVKNLTINDLESLASFITKGTDLLNNKLGKLLPNVNTKPRPINNYRGTVSPTRDLDSIYNTNAATNSPVDNVNPLLSNVQSITGFDSAGGASLYDAEAEVNKMNAEYSQAVGIEGPDEIDVLNNMFSSVEDV